VGSAFRSTTWNALDSYTLLGGFASHWMWMVVRSKPGFRVRDSESKRSLVHPTVERENSGRFKSPALPSSDHQLPVPLYCETSESEVY